MGQASSSSLAPNEIVGGVIFCAGLIAWVICLYRLYTAIGREFGILGLLCALLIPIVALYFVFTERRLLGRRFLLLLASTALWAVGVFIATGGK